MQCWAGLPSSLLACWPSSRKHREPIIKLIIKERNVGKNTQHKHTYMQYNTILTVKLQSSIPHGPAGRTEQSERQDGNNRGKLKDSQSQTWATHQRLQSVNRTHLWWKESKFIHYETKSVFVTCSCWTHRPVAGPVFGPTSQVEGFGPFPARFARCLLTAFWFYRPPLLTQRTGWA